MDIDPQGETPCHHLRPSCGHAHQHHRRFVTIGHQMVGLLTKAIEDQGVSATLLNLVNDHLHIHYVNQGHSIGDALKHHDEIKRKIKTAIKFDAGIKFKSVTVTLDRDATIANSAHVASFRVGDKIEDRLFPDLDSAKSYIIRRIYSGNPSMVRATGGDMGKAILYHPTAQYDRHDDERDVILESLYNDPESKATRRQIYELDQKAPLPLAALAPLPSPPEPYADKGALLGDMRGEGRHALERKMAATPSIPTKLTGHVVDAPNSDFEDGFFVDRVSEIIEELAGVPLIDAYLDLPGQGFDELEAKAIVQALKENDGYVWADATHIEWMAG